MREFTCTGCGCRDSSPCIAGCFWTWKDEQSGAGLCSQCAALPLDELEARIASPALVPE